MMRKEAVITGGLALIGAYLYSQGEGEKSNNQLTGGGYIPKKMILPVEPPVEPSSNITYNIQFPELNIPQYTPSFTSEPFTSEPSPETLTKKSKKHRISSFGSPIMMDMLSLSGGEVPNIPPPPSPTVDALKKKDILPNIGLNIPPPPGLSSLSSMADALKKTNKTYGIGLNIPPPPGLSSLSSMADALTDALTKGLGSITGALKKKELKKKELKKKELKKKD
jgi:hypothetical protein